MRKDLGFVILGVLAINLACTAWLLNEARQSTSGDFVSGETIAQTEKLYKLVGDFQTEYENAVGSANYPDEGTKKSTQESLRNRTLSFQRARLAFQVFKKQPTKSNLGAFVDSICGGVWSCSLVEPPYMRKIDVGKMENGRWVEGKGEIQYGNTARLESMSEEFKVLLTSMLKELQ